MAQDYSQWTPGQPVPAEPNVGDWLNTLVRSGLTFGGFYSDTLPFGTSGDSFAGKVGNRDAWQKRASELGYMNGVDTFPPAKAPKKAPGKQSPSPSPSKPPTSSGGRPNPNPGDVKMHAMKNYVKEDAAKKKAGKK